MNEKVKTDLTIASVALGAFFVGALLSYVMFFRNKNSGEVLTMYRRSISSVSINIDYMPAIILFIVTICFTGGLGYIIKNQLYAEDKEKSKDGIKNALGVSWGLFIFAAVLIPFAISSAGISADSKYYLMASLFTFYFATLAAIIIFFDKLHTLPEQRDKLELNTTYHTLIAMFILLVGYGICGVLIM